MPPEWRAKLIGKIYPCGRAVYGSSISKFSVMFVSPLSLKVQEAKLDKIAQEQGSSVEEFVSLVKENQETLNGLKVGFSCVVRVSCH